ncbi:MAG: zinc ribbon domain-containing protein [Chloroflexi bacterium]|nr:zinc ribbon domain-containing protein [Chloroflexota bacterium]MDA1240790.1 zinc ribbon domain-containing protein [Chloroflexota bacterium]
MPLYEYYCQPCNGVFELLRPTRDAGKAQPCPECDDDAKRIMSREWAAFTFREGAPRRIPDDGTYWHLDKKVLKPLTSASGDGGLRHPEIRYDDDAPKSTTIEEIERYEARQEWKRKNGEGASAFMTNDTIEREDQKTFERMTRTRGSEKQERAKRSVISREYGIVRDALKRSEREPDKT